MSIHKKLMRRNFTMAESNIAGICLVQHVRSQLVLSVYPIGVRGLM